MESRTTLQKFSGRQAGDVALLLGAALRLSRFVVADDLGKWWIKDPIDRLMDRKWEEHTAHLSEFDKFTYPEPWWWKYRSGLDCPFCIGFWIGAAALTSYTVLAKDKTTRTARAWRFVAATLTLNEVAGHLGARLGDTASDEE